MSIIHGRNRVIGLWLHVLVPDLHLNILTGVTIQVMYEILNQLNHFDHMSFTSFRLKVYVKEHSNEILGLFSIYRGLAHFIDAQNGHLIDLAIRMIVTIKNKT